MKIYVIIVTYNAERWLDYSIRRLRDIKTAHKVIVIDNNSSDNTCGLILQHFPEVDLVSLKENIGFGRANNIGIKKAFENNADYVLLLNQDAWLESDTLDLLIKASVRNVKYGILSPIHLDGLGSSLDYNFCKYLNTSDTLISDLSLKSTEELKDVYDVDFVNAAIWLLPRKTIEKVGGFNPIFFMYGEDRDYVNRCCHHKLRVGVVFQARGYHGRIQKDSFAKKKQFQRIMQLINMLDPNKDLTVGRRIRSLFANIIAHSILLDLRVVSSLTSDLFYFLLNSHRIKQLKKTSKSCVKPYI